MARIKLIPKAPRSAPASGPTTEVLTLSEAATFLRLSEAEVLRLIREQGLPARQAGQEWRLLLTAIRDWLGSGKPPESNKEAWMKLLGVWKDDPTLDELREEIQRYNRYSNSGIAE